MYSICILYVYFHPLCISHRRRQDITATLQHVAYIQELPLFNASRYFLSNKMKMFLFHTRDEMSEKRGLVVHYTKGSVAVGSFRCSTAAYARTRRDAAETQLHRIIVEWIEVPKATIRVVEGCHRMFCFVNEWVCTSLNSSTFKIKLPLIWYRAVDDARVKLYLIYSIRERPPNKG